ncbi:uncharacterized protein LOC123318800 [Coccinella septempunctata]|uniref:uncharacterized protein LOC123318800 n=1 Tax=Coccinella septempunctata TaxID=41139 RepID=UPI001D098E1A|nr:uncharacterized protein LOC123318800 [Coccinella septempunctata]
MSKYFKTASDKKRKSTDPFGAISQICHQKDEKKALANYSTWLQERHAVHNKLSRKLKRQSGELLMNVGEESNQVKEEKKALEYTRIPQTFDKYRGNPEWWEFPPGLHDKCSCSRQEVTYFYQKTKEQRNEIPEIEKVGLPGFIKNEKMLYPRTRNVYRKWQDSNYRKNRVEELSSLLKNIEPHNPEFDRLIVIGRNAPCKHEESQTITSLSKSFSDMRDGRRKTSVYDSSLKCCLKINGVYFYENSQSLSTSRKFHVLFEYDVQSLPLQTQYIVFENVGRVTIRISWKKMKKFRLFRDITKRNNTEFFCFDKNMLILVPGQIFNFPIWFRTKKVCTVVDTWEITTIPKFWSESIRVFFVLQAQTHIENFMTRIRNIKLTINQRVKKRIIKEIIEDIMKKSKYQVYKTIDYSYYEPELFEAMNFDDSQPLREPKYQYDKDTVEQLKKFYAEVRQSYHPKRWNLNVWDLQILARVKDLIDYAEMRTSEFSRYRAMMASKCDMLDDKKRSTSEIILKNKLSGSEIDGQSDPFLQKESRYGQLMKLLWNMSPPSISVNTERTKYFQVYSIFNAYFTLISLELHQIKTFSTSLNEHSQNSQGNVLRLIFEKFDETQLIRTKRAFQEDTYAQPKPEILQDISATEVQKIHSLYFTSTSSYTAVGKKADKNEKKKGKQEDNRMSKAKPSQIPSTLSRSSLDEMGLVNLDFDPFDDIPEYPRETLPMKRSSVESGDKSHDLSEKGQENENNNFLNIYVIIYTHLCNAIDAMVDALESAREYKVPHENIEQLKACFKLFLDEEEVETEDRPINPFTNPEERDYFEKILRAHLNEVTGKYLICGKTEEVTIQRHPVSFWSAEKEIIPEIPQAPSIFSLYKPVPDEIRYVEKGAQTPQVTEVYEIETVSFGSKEICECPSEYRQSPASPPERFYYSDDEVFGEPDDQGGVSKETSSRIGQSSSDEANEIPKKSASSVRGASLSLLKEWNKKQCSKNELEEVQNRPT